MQARTCRDITEANSMTITRKSVLSISLVSAVIFVLANLYNGIQEQRKSADNLNKDIYESCKTINEIAGTQKRNCEAELLNGAH